MSDPTMAYMYDQLRASADSQPMKVYCALCPEFMAEGTAEETRAASAEHRSEAHPELTNKRRIVRKRRSFSQSMTEEREAEIEEERRKRMRALGMA